jgi:hypothetical protein
MQKANIIGHEFEVTGTGTAWAAVDLPGKFGTSGQLLTVKVRQDAGDTNSASAVAAYVANGGKSALAAAPDDLDVFYQSDTTAFTKSATAAGIADNPAAAFNGFYALDRNTATDKLTFGLNVTCTGDWTFYVYVQAAVH